MTIDVLFVASECAPFVKTGGLADVVGAVPKALANQGVRVRVMLPAYPELSEPLSQGNEVLDLGILHGGPARLVAVESAGLDLLLLDAPHLFDRAGSIYLNREGIDWPDNHLRFGALSYAAAEVALGGLAQWKPDLVHAHDWQAGLLPAYLRFDGRAAPPCVLTIHNIAFQGLFAPKVIGQLSLPSAAFTAQGYEYYGQVSFLKAALVYADRLTTVSPTYATELLSAQFGMGLEGVLEGRKRDLVGILNGIDTEVWDPASDPLIEANYRSNALKKKSLSKAALEERFALDPDPQSPVFCVISRLTEQKGLDLLIEVLGKLVERGGRLAVLGSGDKKLEQAFGEAAYQYRGKVGVVLGYDEPLSHLMQAGADAIIIPSRFEPCGLTQLYGLRYGTIPVVARTGGLADTVIDANDAALVAASATGFQFQPGSAIALDEALGRACDLYANPTVWRKMVVRAMKHPVGWDRSAKSYAELYESLINPLAE